MAIKAKMENREQKFLLKLKGNLKRQQRSSRKYQSHLAKPLLMSRKSYQIWKILVIIEEGINNLKSQRPEPIRIESEGTGKIKPPCFDGSSPLSVFKFQFERVTSKNGWADEEQAFW